MKKKKTGTFLISHSVQIVSRYYHKRMIEMNIVKL